FGATDCGCADTSSDRFNCGTCRNACSQGEACVSGTCRSDLVAACFNTHQLFSLEASSLTMQSNPLLVGDGLQSLAFYRPPGGPDLLAVVDTISSALFHVSADGTPQALAGYDPLGAAPNQVITVDNACPSDGGYHT